MEQPPREIDGARVLAFAIIEPPVAERGTTLHRVNGVDVGPFAALAICQYPGDEDVYLFYCSEEWHAVTDACRDSVGAAKGQAAVEYDGINSCWRNVD